MRLLLSLAFLLFCGSPAFAAELNLSASASPTKLPPGESFQLTIKVEGSGIKSLPEPVLPQLKYFEITGKGVNQEVSMVNLDLKVAKSIVYTVKAPKEGTFEIPSVTLDFEGKKYATKPITIVVDPKAPAPSSSKSQSASSNLDKLIGGSLFPRSRKLQKDDVFITMDVNKKDVVPYEPITATFAFFRAVDLYEQPTYVKPEFKGFWVEEMQQMDKTREFNTTEERNGKMYHVARLRYSLIPISTGQHTIDSAKVFITVDPWSDRAELATRPLTVTVSPFPEKGKPAEFKGMVGRYSITSEMEPVKAPVNSNVAMRITITGDGYIKPVEPPAKPVVEGFEIFEPKITDTIDKGQGKLVSKRIIEFPMIPRVTGDKTIPPVSFTWYDPEKRAYEKFSTPEIPVTVTASAGGAGGFGTRGEVAQLKSGMRYIKPNVMAMESSSGPVYRNMWGLIALALPVPALFACFVYAKRRRKLLTDSGFARMTFAAKNAKLKLEEAESAEDQREFFACMDNAVRGYLADRWNIPAPSVTAEVISERIGGNGGGLRDGFIELLSAVEMGRYAPVAEKDRAGRLEIAKSLIDAMEKSK